MAARVFFYLSTLPSLVCEVTESNLAAAASTFHFIDRHWLHKAVIKPPPQRLPEPRWARTGTSRLVWKVLRRNWFGNLYTFSLEFASFLPQPYKTRRDAGEDKGGTRRGGRQTESHLRNGLINAIDGTEREVWGGDGAAAERCGLIEIILTSSSNLFRGNTLQIHK